MAPVGPDASAHRPPQSNNTSRKATFAETQDRMIENARQQRNWKRSSKWGVFRLTALTIGLFVLGYQINGIVRDWRQKTRVELATYELMSARGPAEHSAEETTRPEQDKSRNGVERQRADPSGQASAKAPLMDQKPMLRQIVLLEERRAALLRQKKEWEEKIQGFREEVRQRNEQASRRPQETQD